MKKVTLIILFVFLLNSIAIADSVNIYNSTPTEVTYPWYMEPSTWPGWIQLAISIGFSALFLILGGFFSVYISNINTIKKHRIENNSEWFASVVFSDSGWIRQKVVINKKWFGVIIKTIDETSQYAWQASVKKNKENTYWSGQIQNLSTSEIGGVYFKIGSNSQTIKGTFELNNGENKSSKGTIILSRSDEVLETLERGFKEPIFSFDLSPVRVLIERKWYLYHLSQSGEEDVWLHSELKFSANEFKQNLSSELTVMNPENKNKSVYTIEGGVRSPHGIFIIKSKISGEGVEAPAILIFPFLARDQQGPYYGVVFGDNWNKSPFVGQVILSQDELYEHKGETPRVVDINEKKNLSIKWRSKFTEKNRVGKNIFKRHLEIRGTDNVYIDFTKELERRENDKPLKIDVIAFTMYSLEPKLREWYQNGLLRQATINIYHLDQKFINESRHIQDFWAGEVEKKKTSIDSFLKSNEKQLKKLNVRINLKAYSHLPAIHGFKVEGGTYYISFATWETGSTYIRKPVKEEIYIRVSKDSQEVEDRELRILFDNWLNGAINS